MVSEIQESLPVCTVPSTPMTVAGPSEQPAEVETNAAETVDYLLLRVITAVDMATAPQPEQVTSGKQTSLLPHALLKPT